MKEDDLLSLMKSIDERFEGDQDFDVLVDSLRGIRDKLVDAGPFAQLTSQYNEARRLYNSLQQYVSGDVKRI